MNREQLTRKLESLDSAPLADTETLLSEIIQLVEAASEDPPSVNFALLKLSETLTRTKEVEPLEKLKHYEVLFRYVIETALKFELNVGSDSLRLIFDSASEFYRKNMLDNNVEHPLGRERPLKHHFPAVGEDCDVVRPGLTTTSRMGWTRCRVLSISNSGVYGLRFWNSNETYNIGDGYWFAPLGERTPEFEWRKGLGVGDLVDALDGRYVWYLSTILETKEENGCWSARVGFRYYDDEGDKTDGEGRKFVGWGANEDEWVDLSSPRLQPPRTMLKKLCYYASTSHTEFVMDDNSDLVYLKEFNEKPFYAMLRSSMTRSQMLYTNWSTFVEEGGMQKVLDLVRAGKNTDAIFNMAIALSLSCFTVPRMATQSFYSEYVKQFVEYVKNNARVLNNQRLDMCLWTLEAVCKRYLTLCQKHDLVEDLKRFLIPRFLTMNLEKQLLALKSLYDLIKPLRVHSEESEQRLVDYIRENNLFYLVYQPNESHEQVLFRSTQLLEYMLKKKMLTLKELDHLWNLFPLNDAKARVTLQKLIGDVLHEMDGQQITYVLEKLIDVQAHEFTMDHLQLLGVMKAKNKLEGESYTRALQLLWQLLTIKSATVKAAVETEAEKIFRSFSSNVQDERVRFELLGSMLQCLKETKNLQKEPSFLKEYILSYKVEQDGDKSASTDDYPSSRPNVVSYLCANDIYSVCLGHLSNTKVEHKIQEILNLLTSLIENDRTNDLSLIAKQVYEILGPSERLLKWLSSLSLYLHKFVESLFLQTADFEPFANLSLASLHSLSSMFNDINAIQGKRRFVREKLEICDIAEIEWNSYVFTMCRPEELLGMSFVENLLEVPQNAVVYAKLVEFIVKLNVHLDESLFGQIQKIRREFLNKILEEFREINQKGELDDKFKHRLQSRISILNEFIDETETTGLKGVEPYFRILKGESMNLKVQNNVPGSKNPKETEIFVTDNITLDNLKDEIAAKLEEKKDDISLLKGKRVYEDKFNGRSLSDLKITKGDVIRVEKAKIPQALRAPLLNESRTELSPPMKEVAKRIYSIYADLEKATVLSKANFFKLCSDILKADGKEDEAKKVAENDNSTNKDVKFSQEELNKELLDRIKTREEPIWKFVESLGIQQDLRIEHKEVSKELPVTAMPRHILSDPSVYETLLAMLKNPSLAHDHTALYKLLCSLPIYEKFRQEVFGQWTAENFHKGRSVFEINYILGLTEAELSKEQTKQSIEQEFSITFAKSGIQPLLQYLKDYHFEDLTQSVYSLNQMEKVVVSIIVRILAGYFRISSQPNAFVSQVYFEPINELQLEAFIEKTSKKADLNEHDAKYKEKFEKGGVVIPVQEISHVAVSILQNLVETYTENYIKELVPEVSRLCSILDETSPEFIKTLLNGLKIDSINLRRTATNLLYLRASQNNELLASLLTQMLENIPSQNKSTTIQYFDLLTKLIELGVKQNANSVDLLKLAEELLNRVLEYKSDERRTSIIPDRIILGLLSVLNCIFAAKPEVAASLTSYKWKLLSRCLFYPDPKDKIQEIEIPADVINTALQPEFFDDYINAKTCATRAMLINVILHLAKHRLENEPDFLEAVLDPILQQVPEKPKKPNTKGLLVGVQNLGAICYMSSMCQSLNTVSGFRNGLSMVEKADSKLIAATQRMLAYLLFSQRQDYTPSAFLESFRQPINPQVQQDTTEFLNLYFDELEHELQPTPYRSLLRQLFQGSTVIQMICKNCGNKRERSEEYFCYSVGVREKPTLELALEAMHEGDIINDYMCEACGVKSDLTKRSVLGDLPNFLFLHLQRIVNLDFYRYTKIHSKCLFPLELNIEPFTKEGVELREQFGVEYLKKLPQNQQQNKRFQELCKHGKPDKSYIYNLKSIIVHSGSADGGHYYTITKREGGWAKMDDSKATIFTLEQFEAECYGGPFNVIGDWGIEESKNAYVLLYEKEQKSLINLDFSEHPEEVIKFQIDLETSARGIEYEKFKTFNTAPLYKEVWLDNHKLMLESHVFGEVSAKDFIRLIENVSQTSTSSRKAELIAEVLFKISVWSNEVGNLMAEFEKCRPGYEIFLKYVKDYEAVLNMLFHTDKNVRAATSKFLSTLIINSVKEGGETEQIYRFLDFLLSKLNTDVAKNWQRLESYFEFLLTVVQFSPSHLPLYDYVLSKHLISALVDFILEKDSPLKISVKKHSMGNKFNNVQFQDGVKIIYWLVERSYYFNGKNEDEQVQGAKFHLSDNDVFALSCMGFYTKMIKEGQAVAEIGNIIERLSVENVNFLEAASRNLLRILNDSVERLHECVNIIACIEKVLLVKDSLWSRRAEYILGLGQPYQLSKDNTFPSLDMDRFSYNSILEDVFPIECVLNLAFISRQRYPEISIYLVRLMLRVTMSSVQATEFFRLQPPPNYLYTEYTDWWDSFVCFAFETLTTKTIKEEELTALKLEINNLLFSWKVKPQALPESSKIITGRELHTYKRISTKYDSILVELTVEDTEVYAVPSHPSADNQSNSIFSKHLTHQRLEDAGDTISPESNILRFMTTSKPALAITENEKVETASHRAQTNRRPVYGPLTKDQVYYSQETGANFNIWDEIEAAERDQEVSCSEQLSNSQSMQVEEPNLLNNQNPNNNNEEEITQNVENSSQNQMIVEPQIINLEEPISVVQFFRTVTITNHSDESLWIRILIPNVNYLQKNCLIPHLISGSVLPHKSQSYLLYKLDPEREFGDFDYEIVTEDAGKRKKKVVGPSFFKVYGDQAEEPVVQMEVEEEKEPQNPATGQQDGQEGDGKLCPICTYSNEPFAEKCEMCETALM